MKKKWIFILLIPVLLVVGGLYMYRSQTREGAAEFPRRLYEVQRETVEDKIVVDGRLEAARRATVRAREGGELVEVFITVGDQVEAGDLLGRIDMHRLAVEIKQLERRLELAKQELEHTRVKYEDNSASRRELERAEHDYLELAENLELKRMSYANAAIHAPFGGTVTELAAEIGDHLRDGDEFAVVADLDQMRVVASIDEFDLEYVERGAQAVVVPSAFPGRRLSGTVEHVALEGKEKDGGVYFEVHVLISNPNTGEDGQTVETPGRRPPVPSSGEDRVLPEDLRSRFEGEESLPDRPERPTQPVTAGIPAEAESSESGENAAERLLLKPGMTVEVEIISRISENVPVVPHTALHYRGDQVGVLVREGEEDVFRPVEIGLSGERFVEISRGLEVGEEVVIIAEPIQIPTQRTDRMTIQRRPF